MHTDPKNWKNRFTAFETGKILPWWKQPSAGINVSVMRLATRLGDGWIWVLVAPFVFGKLGWLAGFGVAWRATLVGLVSVVVYKSLKNTFNRPRPFERNQMEPLQAPPDRFSFPSGHTMNNLAVALTIGHFLPELLPYLLPTAVLVGFSRVYLRVHYPTDVLVGGLLGYLISYLLLLIPFLAHLHH